jgi:hypothetical protein
LFGLRPPSSSSAASSDWGDGIVAALPANAAATNQYVSINSVSCPSAGNCSAVGSYVDSFGDRQGLLLTETAGKWGVGLEALLPGNLATSAGVELSAVACASAGNCTAVGHYGENGLLLSETDGNWAPGAEAVLPANARSSDQSVDLTSVSCPSAGNCSAVGSYLDSAPNFQGLLLNEAGGKWSTGVEVSLPGDNQGIGNAFLDSVSCASAGDCTAVGYYEAPSPINDLSRGLLVSETAGTWAAGVEAPLPANAAADITTSDVDSVSCASPGDCTAVGIYGDNSDTMEGLLLTETDGSWATGVEALLPANDAEGGLGSSFVFYGGSVLPLSSVSCAAPGDCTAVGSYPDSSGNTQGLLLNQTGGTWAAGVEATLPTDAAATPQGVDLASVSCASPGNCGAVGSYGVSTGGGAPLLLTESGGSWASGVEPSLPDSASQATFSVKSVSCASADACSAAGGYSESSGDGFGLLIGGAPALVTLTVSNGAGSGSLSSSPAGISCGTTCSHAYAPGTPLTLTATSSVGSPLAGWSGCKAVDTVTCATTIDSDTTVTLASIESTQTRQPKRCQVPDLKGKRLAEADSILRTQACAVGAIERVVSGEIHGVQVISQSPQPGTRLKHGAKVDIVVASAGPFHCRVPELVGLSASRAEEEIRLADCRVDAIQRRPSTLRRENHIVGQNPARRRTRPAGARILLVEGRGPRTGRLPTIAAPVPSRLPPFIAYEPPAGGTWLMRPDGSDAHQVGPPDAAGPAWSPDAKQILYSAAAPQNDSFIRDDLYLMNADGADRRPLMPSGGGEFHGIWGDGDFHWSPDGKRIVFSYGQYMSAEIGIANADGSDEHLVPNTDGGGEASFSPDGNYVVFVGNGGGAITHPDIARSGLYVIRPDGTGLRELTFGGGVEAPSWSPDGTHILYGCLVDGGGRAHAICELSGNPARQRILYRNPNQTFLDPTWNADGTKILVTEEQSYPALAPGGIALMSPSGGAPLLIGILPALGTDPNW